jgi:hypothetical protein
MSSVRRTNFPGCISHPCGFGEPIKEGIHASDVPWIHYDVHRWEKPIAISTHFHALRRHFSSAKDGAILVEK